MDNKTKNEETFKIDNRNISAMDAKDYTDKKISNMNLFISAIIVVLLIGFVQLIIDSFRFSSVTYKEYSEKIESVESLNNTNKELLEQNKNNQDIIIEQQKNILKLMN